MFQGEVECMPLLEFGSIVSLMLLLILLESLRTLRGCNVARDFFDLLLNSWKKPRHLELEACLDLSSSHSEPTLGSLELEQLVSSDSVLLK